MKDLFNREDFYDPCQLFGREDCKEYGTAPKYEGSGTVEFAESFSPLKSYYMTAHDATLSDYEEYAKKLEASGFSLYYSTEAKDSRFSTYTDGYNIINLSYVEYIDPFKENNTEHYVSIAIDSTEVSSLPPLEGPKEKLTESQLTVISTQPAFIIRLEDGRFILVDGGVDNGACGPNADLIYQQLTEQNVREGKPVVAAWIVTHPHADHIAGVVRLGQKHGDKFELERIIVNLPGERRLEEECIDDFQMNIRWGNVMCGEGIHGCFHNSQLIIAHAGQKFDFGAATMNIFYTHENLYNRALIFGNMVSNLFSIDTPRGKMIFTGDQLSDGTRIAKAIWGEKLKSDFVQYAHHGHQGGAPEFYRTVGAKYGLWTSSYESLVDRMAYGKTRYNGVDPNSDTISVVTSIKDAAMILRTGMTKEEISKYVRWEYDEENFYNPKKVLGHDNCSVEDVGTDGLEEPFEGSKLYYEVVSHAQVYQRYIKSLDYFPKKLFGREDCKGYGTAPKYEGSGKVEFTENTEKPKSYYVTAYDATVSDYEEYAKKLERFGFKLHCSTKSKEDMFSTYTDGYNIINLSYIEHIDESDTAETKRYVSIAIDCICNAKLPPIGQ